MSEWDIDMDYESTEESHYRNDNFVERYSLINGRNLFRIAPPVRDKIWRMKVGMHFSVNPLRKMIVCPLVTFQKRCFVCEAVNGLLKEGKKNEVKEISVRVKYAMIVLDRIKNDGVWRLVNVPPTVINAITAYIMLSRTNVTHPETGCDIGVIRSGEGFDTKYQTVVIGKPSIIDKDLLPSRPDLASIYTLVDYETTKQLYEGTYQPKSRVIDSQQSEQEAECVISSADDIEAQVQKQTCPSFGKFDPTNEICINCDVDLMMECNKSKKG